MVRTPGGMAGGKPRPRVVMHRQSCGRFFRETLPAFTLRENVPAHHLRNLSKRLCSVAWFLRRPPLEPVKGSVMKAICWHGKEDVRVDTVPDPKIADPGDVIV